MTDTDLTWDKKDTGTKPKQKYCDRNQKTNRDNNDEIKDQKQNKTQHTGSQTQDCDPFISEVHLQFW